jgi:glycerol-3-phosphate cytidylyltransferase
MTPIDLRGMTAGFTCSAFDLLHAGHVAMLRECKQHCNFLIVGLHVDPTVDRPSKNKPVQSVYERYMQLKGCQYVDAIIPYETEEDLINIMAIEPIDIRFVGVEYKDTYITGQDICEKRGINIMYNERYHMYSSTELRSRLT